MSIHAHVPGCKDMNVRVLPPMNSSRGQTICGGLGVRFLQMSLSSPIPHIILPPCSVVMAYNQETLQDVILSPYITGRWWIQSEESVWFLLSEAHCTPPGQTHDNLCTSNRIFSDPDTCTFEGIIHCFVSKVYAMWVSLHVLCTGAYSLLLSKRGRFCISSGAFVGCTRVGSRGHRYLSPL